MKYKNLFLFAVSTFLCLYLGKAGVSQDYLLQDLGAVQFARPSDQHVWSLAVGSDGRLYGTTSGWTLTNAQFFIYDPTDGHCLNMGNIVIPSAWSVARFPAVAGQDGYIYLGGSRYSAGPILYRYDPSNDSLTELGTLDRGTAIRSLAAAADGNIYGANDHGSLFVFDPSDPKAGLKILFTQAMGPYGIENTDILSLTVGADGWVYGGTSGVIGMGFGGHLFAYDPKSAAFTDFGEIFPGGNAILSLAAGPDGGIYGGTYGAGSGIGGGRVFRYDPMKGTIIVLVDNSPTSAPTSVAAGEDGQIYMSSYGRLLAYNTSTGDLVTIGQAASGASEIDALIGAPGAGVYGGTGRNGHVFAYAMTRLPLMECTKTK
jgi:hypothetical protein